MKKSLLAVMILGIALFTGWQSMAQNPQTKSDKLKQFMRQKLEHSKGLLEGITLNEADKIAQHSKALSLLSMESSWNVLTTEKYIEMSSSFRKAADAINKAGKEEDYDRAALSYFDLTLRCMECHKYMREKPAPATKP
ncbi:MAG: hypothetical protein U0905_02900 [Pirellulales bacterium]